MSVLKWTVLGKSGQVGILQFSFMAQNQLVPSVLFVFFLLRFVYLLAALGLHCCMRAFST